MSIFELNEKLGFNPPMELESVSVNYSFQFGRVRINELVQKLKQGSFTFDKYDYLENPIINITRSKSTLFLNNSKKYPKFSFAYLPKQYTIPYYSAFKEYYFETFLSTKRGYKISKNNPTFSTNINLSNGTYIYRVLFSFDEPPTSEGIADEYGIVIQTRDFEAFEVLTEDLGLNISDIQDTVLRSFEILFRDAGNDRNKLDEVYEHAPNFVVKKRGVYRLKVDLKNLLNGWVDTYETNEEIAVVNILTGIYRASGS